MISIQWYRTDEFQKDNDEYIVHGSVTRYGPQSVASASGLTSCATHVGNFLFQNCNIFSVLTIFKWNKIGKDK